MISVARFFLRDIFTTNAARPPVEAVPATISPVVAKQNGHIVHLPGGEADRQAASIEMTGKEC